MFEKELINYFKEYTSIDNLNPKAIQFLEKYGYTSPDREWVIMEKIHGANFSFVTNGSAVMAAKRSGIISQHEHFFGYKTVYDKYEQDIIQLYHLLKEKNPHLSAIQVYGELFGGYYPEQKSTGPAVQKGVYYHPSVEFLVFDIKIYPGIKPSQPLFLSQTEINELLSNLSHLRAIPVMASGSFEVLAGTNPQFQTTVPTIFGLAPVPNNFAEGLVLKINENCPCYCTRPIIKIKNSKFSETKVKHIPKPIVDTKLINYFLEKSLCYCTETRFHNVISKVGPSERLEKIQGIFVADVLKDLEKDLNENDIDDFRKNLKRIKNVLIGYLIQEKLIVTWINQYNQPIDNINAETSVDAFMRPM